MKPLAPDTEESFREGNKMGENHRRVLKLFQPPYTKEDIGKFEDFSSPKPHSSRSISGDDSPSNKLFVDLWASTPLSNRSKSPEPSASESSFFVKSPREGDLPSAHEDGTDGRKRSTGCCSNRNPSPHTGNSSLMNGFPSRHALAPKRKYGVCSSSAHRCSPKDIREEGVGDDKENRSNRENPTAKVNKHARCSSHAHVDGNNAETVQSNDSSHDGVAKASIIRSDADESAERRRGGLRIRRKLGVRRGTSSSASGTPLRHRYEFGHFPNGTSTSLAARQRKASSWICLSKDESLWYIQLKSENTRLRKLVDMLKTQCQELKVANRGLQERCYQLSTVKQIEGDTLIPWEAKEPETG